MKRAILLVSVGALLLAGVATTGALAQSGEQTGGHVQHIGKQNVAITDLTVTVSDMHVTGTGLPDKSVDHASYTLHHSTVHTDGFDVTYQGTTYQFCPITITADNVGLQVHDVSIGQGS